jgi:hypothetical protein
MHCNGKCQMMKNLKQNQKNDQESPGRKMDNRTEVVLFSESGFASLTEPPIDLKSSKLNFLRPNRPSLILGLEIFHPPKC